MLFHRHFHALVERIRRVAIVSMVLGSNPSNALLLIRCVEQYQADTIKLLEVDFCGLMYNHTQL